MSELRVTTQAEKVEPEWSYRWSWAQLGLRNGTVLENRENHECENHPKEAIASSLNLARGFEQFTFMPGLGSSAML